MVKQKNISQESLSKSDINCGLSALNKMNDLKNVSMQTLIGLADDNGLKLYPYAIVDGEQLMTISFPAIVHSENHFDYISKKEDFDFNKEYTGYVLLTKESEYKKIKVSELKKISGATWASVAAVGVSLGINAINGPKDDTNCGQQCDAKCSTYNFWEFDAKKQCKNRCKEKCLSEESKPPVKPKISIGVIILLVVLVLGVVGLIWWMVRSKK